MTLFKPLCGNKVNKKVARLNAVWVVAFSLIYIFMPSVRWIVFVMVADFFVKGFAGPWYSPVSQINKLIVRALKIEPEMIFAPPKIFAGKVGFIFSLTTAVLYLFNLQTAALVVISILTLFALLEVVFQFCMGCYVFDWWINLTGQDKLPS